MQAPKETMDYKAIANQVLEGIEPSKGRPFYVLAAGGPASHKCFLPFLLKGQGCNDFISISDELMQPFFPPNEGGYPHHEKNAPHVKQYYDLIDEIVKEAGGRGISVVLEDHGDYPDVYKKHIKMLAPRGYDNFLVATTISPDNFNAKIEYLMEHDGLQDFREWGKSYHQRMSKNFDQLLGVFDKGMLIETQPGFISPDGIPHAYGVMRFDKQNGKQKLEVLDEERYETFRQWRENRIQPEFEDYFRAADAVMESRNAERSYAKSIAGSRAPRKRTIEKKSVVEELLAGSVETPQGGGTGVNAR